MHIAVELLVEPAQHALNLVGLTVHAPYPAEYVCVRVLLVLILFSIEEQRLQEKKFLVMTTG